jgi:hypothetical protein
MLAQSYNKPILFTETDLGPCSIYPTGKPPNYAFHLRTCDLHLFIADCVSGERWSNVYASIGAKALWLLGATTSVARTKALISFLGGCILVDGVKPSRCDLCADFHIPGGLSLELFLSLGVPKRLKTNAHLNGGTCETYYIGAKNATIRSRIYDKSKEVLLHNKFWIQDLWGVAESKDVWRVEFQLRRPALRQYGIHSFPKLMSNLCGLWENLTSKFYSLRLLDNPNVSRRTIHPFWKAVQGCARLFGPAVDITRDFTSGDKAGSEFYISRGSWAFLSFAACYGYADLDTALHEFCRNIRHYWSDRDFEEERKMKTIEMGKIFERFGGCYGKA